MLLVVSTSVIACSSLDGRNRNRQGNKLYADAKFVDAVGEFEKALTQVDSPVIHYNAGLAYWKIFRAGYDKPIRLAKAGDDACSQIPDTKTAEARVCLRKNDRHYDRECDDKNPCPTLYSCEKTTFCTLDSKTIADAAARHFDVWIKDQPADEDLKKQQKAVEKEIEELSAKLDKLSAESSPDNKPEIAAVAEKRKLATAKLDHAVATGDKPQIEATKAELRKINDELERLVALLPDNKREFAVTEDRKKELEKRLDLLHTKEQTRGIMTGMWIDSDQFKKALAYWTKLLDEKPNSPDIMSVLAGINLKGNDWETSIDWYKKVAEVSTEPSAKVAAYQFIGNVAWTKLNSKSLVADKAIKLADLGIGALQKASELAPENPRLIGLMGSLFSFRSMVHGASWAAAIDRASTQDLQRASRVRMEKAKKPAGQEAPKGAAVDSQKPSSSGSKTGG
jgi:tetratricopeptide (TPR) repeat protein